jgi:hypothetical protein
MKQPEGGRLSWRPLSFRNAIGCRVLAPLRHADCIERCPLSGVMSRLIVRDVDGGSLAPPHSSRLHGRYDLAPKFTLARHWGEVLFQMDAPRCANLKNSATCRELT